MAEGPQEAPGCLSRPSPRHLTAALTDHQRATIASLLAEHHRPRDIALRTGLPVKTIYNFAAKTNTTRKHKSDAERDRIIADIITRRLPVVAAIAEHDIADATVRNWMTARGYRWNRNKRTWERKEPGPG